MEVQVKLADIIDAMETASTENRVFVNQKTGEVVHLLNEFLRKAENGNTSDLKPAWQQDMIKIAYEIVEHRTPFIEIDSFEINEYDMMERFCYTIKDPEKSESLLNAIRGKGAFRRFKDMVYNLGVAEDWYNYRDAAYESLAKKFCEQYGFTYV